ncbi:hypothetical protein [Bacteroides sp.]|uniref:hypothetical protein n=1 Tax=Bacteroides sp. TaxID=29523 RepID=UPI00262516E9|nr:hypothetical protein [Bacteroides sp.]MDD3040868.1 hypothetical protein [Bacteroides sp.]
MKRYVWIIGLCTLMTGGMTSCGQTGDDQEGARIHLLNNNWNLNVPAAAQATLNGDSVEGTLPIPSDIEKGFTIKCKVNLLVPTFDRHLVEIPGVLDVCLKQYNPFDRNKQNYPAAKMQDGTVPVLEAGLELKSPVDGHMERMTVGVPLAMLEQPWGEHEVVLNFSGVRWTMYVDGQLLDNDFPLGYPLAEKMERWKIDTAFVSQAELFYPAIQPERMDGVQAGLQPQVQFWTPTGHNAWVGDVVSLYHDGTYHLFYLYDRRGHQSKFGRGGHYFEHLSTKDFRHWTEHEAAVPIEEQWETFGTGTPFVFNNQLCISYGYHTTRIYPREQTTLPEMYKYLEDHGHTGNFDRHQMAGVAAGSSYSVSDDGVHFRKTGVLFHPCENPSIYVDPKGDLKMLANYGARGTWASDSVSGGWHCLDENFPLGGDCTFFFHWGNYDYIIGGFTRLWSKQTVQPDSAYQDMVAIGTDFYNGSCVPTITEIFDHRFVMAGWMWMKAWGGPLVIHELVQLPDGRIGTKWMDELLPVTSTKVTTFPENSTKIENLPSGSFLLTFEVTPVTPDGKLSVNLLPSLDKGLQDGCEWRLDGADKRAQYSFVGDGTARERSLREGGAPQQGRNYAIENLLDTDKTFTVRMVVKASDKFDGSMVDTEIAGKRTMVSYREKLIPERLQFRTENMDVKNIRITPLAD